MLQPTDGRSPTGRYVAGHRDNVGRHNPYRYAERARQLEQELTAKQIMELNEDEALLDRPAIDTIVIRRLARAMTNIKAQNCSDVERAADAHFERTEGSVKLPIDGGGKIMIQIIQFGAKDDNKEIIENQTTVTVSAEEKNGIENGQSDD